MNTESKRQVVVVGAGIIGASIAWHLVRSGARVTVIDADEPGGVATPCSFGWINSTYEFPQAYFNLRLASMQAWQRLAGERPGLPYCEGGGLYLHLEDDDGNPVDLEAFVASHSSWGYEIEVICGEALRSRAPNVRELPEVGAWAPCEAVAEGAETARLLLEDCLAAGASLITGTVVDRLLTSQDRVAGIATARGPIEADEVVIAAGAGTPALLGDVAAPLPLHTPPGVLLRTEPCKPLIPHLTLAREVHIRQLPDGSLLAGLGFTGETGGLEPDQVAAMAMDGIQSTFTGAEHVTLARVTIGYRPTPRDGFPIVGRPGNTPGLTVAVMHSGITLAPFVGNAVAAFIETGEMHPLLAAYGPDRFA